MMIQPISIQNKNNANCHFGIKMPSNLIEGWNCILDNYAIRNGKLAKDVEELKSVLKQIQYDKFTRGYTISPKMSPKSPSLGYDNQYFIITSPEGKKTIANTSVKYKKNNEGLYEQIEGAINYFKSLTENSGEKIKKEFMPTINKTETESYTYGDGLRFSFFGGFD